MHRQQMLRFATMIALIVGMLATISVRGVQKIEPMGSGGLEYDWPQFNGNAQHSGNNLAEGIITSDNVAHLSSVAGFPVTLPSPADGAPAYLHGVEIKGHVRDLLFVTTKDGHIIALDARSGDQVWSQQHPAGSCTINGGSSSCYTTSSPAIDPNRQFVYSYGLDGHAHKHQVIDGSEIIDSHWPELATRKPYTEKGSSALSIATAKNGTSYLYVTNGGYPGDAGNYQGHVTTINLQDGSQHVFNAACSNQVDVHFVEPSGTPSCTTVQTAIWARSGVVYDADTDNIYFVTGNGEYLPAEHNWGDSVLVIHPDGTSNGGTPLDSYTPNNYQQLQNDDADLGSTAPAILPVPTTSTVKHLGLQSGKDQKLRLLNLDNLSGQGGPGHTGGEIGTVIPVPQSGEVLSAPAVWVSPTDGTTWAFVGNDHGISALQLTIDSHGTPAMVVKWQQPISSNENYGTQTSPLVAGNVVYFAHNNALDARDPVTGTLLWGSTMIGSVHWSSPVVADGVLYLSDNDGHLFAFAIDGNLPVFHDAYLPYIAH
ncbi:MAG: PQQ-binding-like beta-propeller repeat protein [Herpetosiphonaceae bacterium]|nr:PQQ-binding-like beta-propeller repeat protein [Herpetosiphonaceae bacterium]